MQPRSVILFQLGFFFQEEGPASGSDLGRSTPGQSPYEPRFFLSHFPPRRTSSKPIGPRAALRSFCGDARFVNAIRSSATVAAASRRTMNITTGLGSDAAFATVAGRPSPSFRCFLSLTRTTACWLAVRRSGDTGWSSAPGKRRCPRSKIPIGCPILPRSAAGSSGLDRSQPAASFLRRTLARVVHWLARGDPADPKLGRCRC